MVPPPRIELETYPYHGHVMPLNYRGIKIKLFNINRSIKPELILIHNFLN